jgi:hypothetical protein
MISDLIKSLGGPAGVVDLIERDTGTKLSESSVKMWVSRKRVPYKWRAVLVSAAKRRRLTVPAAISEGVLVLRSAP